MGGVAEGAEGGSNSAGRQGADTPLRALSEVRCVGLLVPPPGSAAIQVEAPIDPDLPKDEQNQDCRKCRWRRTERSLPCKIEKQASNCASWASGHDAPTTA